MISIKYFLDQQRNGSGPEGDVFEALRQMGRLLLDGIATHIVRGQEADFNALRRALHGLSRQIEKPKSVLDLLTSSSEAVEALETYCNHTTEYIRDEKEQMHSMVVLLTDTLADLSGQTDNSTARLQAIEKSLELASGLNDMRAVRSNLESCLLALREAVAQQRSSSDATAARMSRALRDHLDLVQKRTPDDPNHVPFSPTEMDLLSEQWDNPIESGPSLYVVACKLQRAEHISSRLGDAAIRRMLFTVGTELQAALGPDDRLLRWKGRSFVMFINSMTSISGVRARLSQVVAKIGMQHIEVGTKSAIRAVGVDWMVFPQSDHASAEAVPAEVEAFLAEQGA